MRSKKEKQDEKHPPVLLFKGETVNAEYRTQIIEEFYNNPLIEALPEILSPREAAQALAYSPDYSPQHRELAAQYRLLKLENAREFFLPLSRDIELYYCIMNMVRRGYIQRNPILSNYYSGLNGRLACLSNEMCKPIKYKSLRSRARGATICGTGGTGKSTSVENSLSLAPQVVIHKNYKGTDLILKQLVWLKIDCPQDGSVRGLCLAFFAAVDEVLGTSYLIRYNNRKNTINDLLLHMARVAAIHCLGVLVIDEIQDLSEAKSGGQAHLMNFFVHLENSIGVPFILIGTPKALPLFKGEFRQARRASEQGDFLWKRMQMLSDPVKAGDLPQPDPVWNEFVRLLWQYQYVKKFSTLPENILDEPVTQILYNESQGIIAVALTMFLLTQKRAILSGIEEITADVMKSAVRDNQNLIAKMIDSIRLGHKVDFFGESDFESSEFRFQSSPKSVEPEDSSVPPEQLPSSSASGEEVKTNSSGASAEQNKKTNQRIAEKKRVSKNGKTSPSSLTNDDITQYIKNPTDIF